MPKCDEEAQRKFSIQRNAKNPTSDKPPTRLSLHVQIQSFHTNLVLHPRNVDWTTHTRCLHVHTQSSKTHAQSFHTQSSAFAKLAGYSMHSPTLRRTEEGGGGGAQGRGVRPTKGSVEMWEESFTHEKQAERGAGRQLSEGGGRQRGRHTNMPTIWFGNESRSSLLSRSNFQTNSDNSCCYAKLFFLQNLGWDLYSAVCSTCCRL